MEPIALVALLVGGLLAGIINSIAGGGSLITLPLLVFAGLPPTVANATNRVAVAVQGLAAVAGFAGLGRRGRPDSLSESASPKADGDPASHLPWRVVAQTALPTVIGSLVGASVATRIPDETFRPIMGVVLLLMGGLVVLRPSVHKRGDSPREMKPWLVLAFFLAGAYGGFIQAGVGFMLLAALVPGLGLDLVRANGVKVALVLILTVFALLVFVSAGQVDWRAGGVLAIGNGIGGYLGARLAIRIGAPWIRWVLFVMVLAAAFEILGLRALLF